jgi:hypothetical protein
MSKKNKKRRAKVSINSIRVTPDVSGRIVPVRTITAPDGIKVQIGISPLWSEFKKLCDWLKQKGQQPPADVVAWLGRFSTVARIGDTHWRPIDAGPMSDKLN